MDQSTATINQEVRARYVHLHHHRQERDRKEDEREQCWDRSQNLAWVHQ